jgi:hypothetical protein
MENAKKKKFLLKIEIFFFDKKVYSLLKCFYQLKRKELIKKKN